MGFNELNCVEQCSLLQLRGVNLNAAGVQEGIAGYSVLHGYTHRRTKYILTPFPIFGCCLRGLVRAILFVPPSMLVYVLLWFKPFGPSVLKPYKS